MNSTFRFRTSSCEWQWQNILKDGARGFVNAHAQIVANHVVPGLFNTDSFRPHLIYKLPSLFGTLAVQRTEKILKVSKQQYFYRETNNFYYVSNEFMAIWFY